MHHAPAGGTWIGGERYLGRQVLREDDPARRARARDAARDATGRVDGRVHGRLYVRVQPGMTFAACPPDHDHPVVAITVLQVDHGNAMARCRWRNRWGGEEARWLPGAWIEAAMAATASER